MCIHVLKITLKYLLIAEIIEMAQPAPMVNLPRSPLVHGIVWNTIYGIRCILLAVFYKQFKHFTLLSI